MDTDEPIRGVGLAELCYEAVGNIPGVPSWIPELINFVHSRIIALRFGITRGPSFMLSIG